MIDFLELENFRSFVCREFVFSSSDIVLTGANGSGKTSVLEAVYYTGILRSFRGARARELVRIGEQRFALNCRLNNGKFRTMLRVVEDLAGKRDLYIGGVRPGRSSDFIREFRTVCFVPEDREIVSGSSGYRRRFFDMMISGVDPCYLKSLSDYMRALAQRNRALKSSKPDIARRFDEELAMRAAEISSCRLEYSGLISEHVGKLLEGSSTEFGIRYICESSMDKEQNLHFLKRNFDRDRQRGCTMWGPQLDEFEFRFDGKVLRSFGSTGQKGIIALLLKLAEFNVFRSRGSGGVIVLADDVLCDLDRKNSELFLETVKSAEQRFFTFAEMPSFGNFNSFECINL